MRARGEDRDLPEKHPFEQDEQISWDIHHHIFHKVASVIHHDEPEDPITIAVGVLTKRTYRYTASLWTLRCHARHDSSLEGLVSSECSMMPAYRPSTYWLMQVRLKNGHNCTWTISGLRRTSSGPGLTTGRIPLPRDCPKALAEQRLSHIWTRTSWLSKANTR